MFSIVVASVCIPTNIIRGFPFLYTDPSTDEWIRKLWYIYTMEFYSAIRRNTFESVLMGGSYTHFPEDYGLKLNGFSVGKHFIFWVLTLLFVA